MPLRHTVYASVNDVPDAQWRQFAGDGCDLCLDRRFIGAMESTMSGAYSFFTIVVHDDAGHAAALACTWLFHVDLAQFPWLSPVTHRLPKSWRDKLKIGVLFCGLPQPAGLNQLRFAPGADRNAAIGEMLRALRLLARRQKAMLMVIKEFDRRECEQLHAISDAGFLRSQIPPRHRMPRQFTSFADYLSELKARYRSQVNRSLKKFQAAGFRVEQVYGPDRLPEVFTDQAHDLYRAVYDRSDYKLEFLPPEFVREVGRRFGPDASLTCIYLGDRLAGYTLGVMTDDVYYNCISGLDYSLNNQGDIYFNLFYHDLDYAWKRGAREIDLGLTSDDFKSRLGSHNEPLYLYIAARRKLIHWGLRAASKWAFPPMKPVEPHDVFKNASPTPPTSPRLPATKSSDTLTSTPT